MSYHCNSHNATRTLQTINHRSERKLIIYVSTVSGARVCALSTIHVIYALTLNCVCNVYTFYYNIAMPFWYDMMMINITVFVEFLIAL